MEQMTKREIIAALALQGILASPKDGRSPKETATEAIIVADELVALFAKTEVKRETKAD